MSPVFGHGRLRLYLLKLLDEAPRHGYEVIRLLQDRFMGVYSPSPGTIYPRLARLEEEGLLTHDEEDGRKIYRITDKGREEINRRLDELDDLEREITESVSGIAREVKEDVRETVRSLREELTWATREVHKEGKRSAHEQARQTRDEAHERARQVREELLQARGERQGRGETSAQARAAAGGRPGGSTRQDQEERAEQARRDRSGPGWQDWAGWTNWTDWPGRRHRPDAGHRDFEALAGEFRNEVLRAIRQAGALGEGAMDDLRAILEDALQRIRSEVFGPVKPQREEPGSAERGDHGVTGEPEGSSTDAAPTHDSGVARPPEDAGTARHDAAHGQNASGGGAPAVDGVAKDAVAGESKDKGAATSGL
ncbi:MAG TPA: PadR family transcriptional regulator [Streptosporangiaceae bacterium]|nr:PadR family transcriptional regulator [Streptosporangiaceae bacterium]